MKAYALIIAIIFLLEISIATTSPGFNSFGKSVKLNMAFHLGSNKSNDIITYTQNYTSLHDNNVVLALAAEAPFGTGYDELADDYSLFMRQSIYNSRFFLVFTQGSNDTIVNHTIKGIISKTFGSLARPPGSPPLYLRLEYMDIDLVNRVRWAEGSRSILITNEGTNEKNQPMISVEVIK